MAATIAATLQTAGKKGLVTNHAFPGAGHFLNPPGLPTSPPDGAIPATALAARRAWHALLQHLEAGGLTANLHRVGWNRHPSMIVKGISTL